MSAADDWSGISSDPSFQAQTPDVKATVANNFFARHIAPNVPPEHLDDVKQSFMSTLGPAPSLWSKAMSNSVPGGGGITDPLGAIARVGGALNRESQKELGDYVDAQGQASAKRGDYPTSTLGQIAKVAPAAMAATATELLPQNRFAAGTVLLGPALKAARAVGAGVSDIPSILSKFMAPAAEAAPETSAAVDSTSSLVPSYAKPQYANGLLKTELNEQVARNTASAAGDELAASQRAGMIERADALPNMRDLNAQKNTLEDLISKKNSEITDFQNAGGNPNLTPPEQARLKVLTSQLKALGNQKSKIADQLSSAASGPGIQEMAPAQVPEANQIAVGEAEKATQRAQASRYAQNNPPVEAPVPVQPAEAPAPASAPPANYKTPSSAQKALADALSTQNGANPRHLAAVFANPEIMNNAESMAEVGKDYQKTFAKLGQSFDAPTYQEITGSRYAVTSPTQVSKLEGILQNASTKLEQAPETLTAAEAFMARSAGSKLLQGAQGVNKALYAKDLNAMDGFLENNGVPEIKALSQRYFRAAAKDSLERILPANKNGTPSVVRSLLAAHEAGQSLEHLVNGNYTGAALKALSAASKSPALTGGVMRNIAAAPSAIKAGGVPLAVEASNVAGGENTSTLPPILARILAARREVKK